MHRILDSFLSDHNGGQQADETTRRELKIIELLKSKSLSVAAGEPLHSPPKSRKRELPDDGDAEGKSRISALRTIPVPVPRPRAGSSASAPHGGSGSFGPGLTSPGYHGSDRTMGDSSAQSSPMWKSGTLGSASRSRGAGHANSYEDGVADSGTPTGNTTLSPLESSSSAQRLLDNWVNSAQIDSVGSGTFGLNLGLDPTLNGTGGNGWLGGMGMDGGASGGPGMNGDAAYHPVLPRTDSADLLAAASGGADDPTAVDWNYWENLFEHIRASGGAA